MEATLCTTATEIDPPPYNETAMNVLIISPSYPSDHCGIATYTSYFVQSMQPIMSVEVFGRQEKQRLWSWLAQMNSLTQHADVIHIQHAFDVFGYMGCLTLPVYRTLRRSGKPIVTTLHELPPEEPSSLKARLAEPYLRQIVKRLMDSSHAVVVHSEASCRFLARYPTRNKVFVIPHGMLSSAQVVVSCDPTRPRRFPARVGFLGFIAEHKGLHRLIDAIAQIPDVKLVIAGAPRAPRDERYAETLRIRIAQLGLAELVEFRGFIPNDELGSFFREMDVMVFPYSACTASGALALALGHGSVVLTSNLPVFRELRIEYDCLEEFDLENAESLVAKLRWLLTDDSRRAELAAGAARMTRAMSWERIAEQTHALYRSVVASDVVGAKP
jgi:glycosyltransferase involved in cell wall biosynthesis